MDLVAQAIGLARLTCRPVRNLLLESIFELLLDPRQHPTWV
jgi:hypothetical protein